MRGLYTRALLTCQPDEGLISGGFAGATQRGGLRNTPVPNPKVKSPRRGQSGAAVVFRIQSLGKRGLITDIDRRGLLGELPFPARVQKVPHELLFLAVDRDDRLLGPLKAVHLIGDELHLLVAIGMVGV